MRRVSHPGRLTASAVLSAAVLLALSGCGSSSSTSTPTTAASSATTAASAATTAASSATTAASSATTASSSATTAASTATTAGSTGGSSPSVVIGSANFPENEILADIYADALKAKGVKVSTKLNIGAREVYFPELKSGAINVFPEYNGALNSYLAPSSTASSTATVDAALAKELPSSLKALSPSSAQDNDSVTVTAAFAKAHHLKTIADLKSLASSMVIGAAPEFQTREAGLVGLRKVYGLTFKAFKPLDESGPLTIAALKGGSIQAGDIYTTDPSVTMDHFVSLLDPKHLFSVQNIIPIINSKLASDKTVVSTLDAISAALTTHDLVELVGGVVNDHQDASTVAQQFVSQAKLG